MLLLLLLCLSLVLSLSPLASGSSAPPDDGPVATVADGRLRGTHASPHTDAYWGIPYAAAPVGALRWQPPRPARKWNGTRAATRPGSTCIQMGTPQYGSPAVSYDQVEGFMGKEPDQWKPGIDVAQSEDCLFLNVFTPASPPNASEHHVCAPPECNVCAECCHAWIQPGKDCEECYRDSCHNAHSSERQQSRQPPRSQSSQSSSSSLLPVLFWVHGGAFENGAGSLSLYNGTRIIDFVAEQAQAQGEGEALPEQVVVVTINCACGAMPLPATTVPTSTAKPLRACMPPLCATVQ